MEMIYDSLFIRFLVAEMIQLLGKIPTSKETEIYLQGH